MICARLTLLSNLNKILVKIVHTLVYSFLEEFKQGQGVWPEKMTCLQNKLAPLFWMSFQVQKTIQELFLKKNHFWRFAALKTDFEKWPLYRENIKGKLRGFLKLSYSICTCLSYMIANFHGDLKSRTLEKHKSL